jgi:hypothetical protein
MQLGDGESVGQQVAGASAIIPREALIKSLCVWDRLSI